MRAKVIADQMAKDPIIDYVGELEQYMVKNPLEYDAVMGTHEEWSNIPKLVARYCIRMQ